MNKKRLTGFVFIAIAIGIVSFNVGITGAIIGTATSNSLSLVALTFLLFGLIFLSRRDHNYAQEILDRRKYVDKTKDLKKIARKMGYELSEGHNEGTRVYNGDNVLTVIPHHKTVGGKGTSKSILEALATGESSFRKRTG